MKVKLNGTPFIRTYLYDLKKNQLWIMVK